jgi:hypothetical protein
MAPPQFEMRRYWRFQETKPATVSSGGRRLAATVKNVSVGGLFLLTDVRYPVGADIEVLLNMPEQLGVLSSQTARCQARVVRVEDYSGEYGIAAQIYAFKLNDSSVSH